MQLDMSALLSGEKTLLPFSFPYTLSLGEDFPDVAFAENFTVEGSVKDMAGYMCLTLEAHVPFTSVCARCLVEVNGVFDVHLTKDVAVKELLQEEEQERFALIENRKLDLGQVLTEELLISFPSKHLCRPDCKGLCQRCGKDLNEGPCTCPVRELDPRLAVLRKLLESES
jgi:uncharacterized protein